MRAGLTTNTVVQAAAAIADRDGLGGVTMSSLAAALGVKPPSLYAHVGGAGDLRARLASLAAAELAEALAPAVAGRAGGEALRAAARVYRSWALTHPGRNAALQLVPTADEPSSARVTELLLAVMRGYALPDSEAIHAARAFRAAIYGFVLLEAGGGFRLPQRAEDSYERLLDLLDRGLHHHPQAQPQKLISSRATATGSS